MKKTFLGLLCVSLLTVHFAFADDFDGDFETADNAIGEADFSDFAADDFGGDDYGSDPTLLWTGEAGVKSRLWFNTFNDVWFEDFDESAVYPNAYLKLGLDYSGTKSDLSVKLKADTATIEEHPEDILEEATLRGYFGNWTIEAGKLKNVWGKGDKIHVLDNFNANDYTDFIFPDYIDRRLAEPMVKVSYAFPNDMNLKIEGIYTPTMTADRFASSGMLVPAKMASLESKVKKLLISSNSGAITAATLLELASFSADSHTHQFKYGQAGIRGTATFGGFDVGASYYYGHYKQPSVNLEKIINTKFAANVATGLGAKATALDTAGATAQAAQLQAAAQGLAATLSTPTYNDIDVDYDMVQTIGLEMATVIWKFNTRWELAYNITKDFDGSDPWVKNNWISWVGGFDIDIPIHNININVQETGSVIINSDAIADNKLYLFKGTALEQSYSLEQHDVDYNSDDCYHTNKLIVLIKDTFLNEKLTVELQGIWGIENQEFVITPKVSYNVADGLTFDAQFAYMYSDNENGEFYNFTAANRENHNQAFFQFGAKYQF